MKIQADRDRCIGAGMCALIAPLIFDQDEDDGRVMVLITGDPEPDDVHSTERAIAACPSGALSLSTARHKS